MKIACTVKAEFTAPDGTIFNDDFFNIEKKHEPVPLRNAVTSKQNAFAGNSDQGI